MTTFGIIASRTEASVGPVRVRRAAHATTAWALALPAAVLLLGFGLRVGRLEFQSLWYDKGSSLYLARQSLPAITRGAAADIHPPLYYYFLHFWLPLAGSREYGARFLSVASGLLMVALLFALGRRLFGLRAGLLAALLGAASPLAVYYSQETRMYAQVTMFGLLSTYLFVRASAAWPPDRRRLLWLAYGLAVVACLYSQYIGTLALAFQGLWLLCARRRSLPPFMAAAGAAVACYAPWLWLARGSLLGWPSTDAFHAGPQLFADAAFRYLFGMSAAAQPATLVLAGGLVLAALLTGIYWLLKSGDRAWLLAALYLVVPLAAMFALGYRKPIYNPKFGLLALPGALLIGGAVLSRLRLAAWPLLACALAAGGFALYNNYANPAFARDNYRGLAQFIASSQRPGDAIILNAPGQEQIFPDYYDGGLPVVGLPADRPLDPGKTAQQLTRLSGQYQRLWLVLYGTNGSDPDGFVEHWLAGRDYEIKNLWFGNVRLAAFAAPSSQPAQRQAANATIGTFAHLTGYTLTPQPVASGDVLQLGLQWQATATPSANYKVFTHVIDGQGNIWAQRDSDPVGGARPTGNWKAGESIADNYGLLVLPGTPPGQYQVEIGMYDPASGKRLPISAGGQGDSLVLGHITVAPPAQPPSVDELAIPHPLEASSGPAGLLGYGLTLVGQDVERSSFAPGDTMQLTLLWQARAAVPAGTPVSLELGGRVLARTQLQPAGGAQPGARYRNQFRLVVPKDGRGSQPLTVSLAGGPPIRLTTVRVG